MEAHQNFRHASIFPVSKFFALLEFAHGHDVCVSAKFFDVAETDAVLALFLLVLERNVASQVVKTFVAA